MALIQGAQGISRNYWPPSITAHFEGTDNEYILPMPCTLDGIGERIVIEQSQIKVPDRARRFGVFMSDVQEQKVLSIRFYGYIKTVQLTGYGNWNGTLPTASRAELRLVIDGRGWDDAFKPQLDFVHNVQVAAEEALQGEPMQIRPKKSTISFQHVVFRKTGRNDLSTPLGLPRGMDPTGRLARIARHWRLNERPSLFRRAENGEILATNAAAFNIDDFVEIVAHPEIIFRDNRGVTHNTVHTVAALDKVTKLFSGSNVRLPATDFQAFDFQGSAETTNAMETHL